MYVQHNQVNSQFYLEYSCSDPEEYNECGNQCLELCDDGSGHVCTLQCQTGCFCKSNYKRDPFTGLCVPENECPVVPKCGENEVYSLCGNSCFDQCNDGTIRICPLYCQSGCFCAQGYKRNADGICVPENRCSVKSKICKKKNEE
uniref:CSON009304 protein n=1 Tax=Culicoides sonorensis TaxID=179676 RepID=A0A336MC08_CULSO